MHTPESLLEAYLSLQGKKAELPSLPTEPPLTAKDVAQAVAEALGQFTDERGNLKVRLNTGGHAYGGGGS